MDQSESVDEITIHQIGVGQGDGADILFDFNGQLISVSIFPQEDPGSEKNRLIALLERSIAEGTADDEIETINDDVLGVILRAGRHLFRQCAPRPAPPTQLPQNLHALISRTILHFELKEDDDSTVCVCPIEPDQTYRCHGPNTHEDAPDQVLSTDNTLPRYSTSDIIVTEAYTESVSRVIGKVLVDGQVMFCKACTGNAQLQGSDIERELWALEDMHLKKPHKQLRAPELLGSVVNLSEGRLIGFVRQWIPGRTLKQVVADDAPTDDQRQRWAAQIRESVDALHDAGLVWGDGKPSNIVIDDSGDAWLIDFGGGFTDGWVDGELSDTVEGDKQAVARLVEFLGRSSDTPGE